MRFEKIIKKRIRRAKEGVQIAGDVNAAISASVNEPGPTHASVKSRQQVVQRGGRTVVDKHESITPEEE